MAASFIRGGAAAAFKLRGGAMRRAPAVATGHASVWSSGVVTANDARGVAAALLFRRALSTAAGDFGGMDFEKMLLKNGRDDVAMKRCYLGLARDFHPDANPDDPEAAAKFIHLGKVYEKLQKKVDQDLEGDDDDDDDDEEDYGEEQARATYSGAGGPILTREMKRELKKIREEMASGGARDGGWFALAAQYGDDDGVQDLPGGPSFSKPALQLENGKKKRRRKRS